MRAIFSQSTTELRAGWRVYERGGGGSQRRDAKVAGGCGDNVAGNCREAYRRPDQAAAAEKVDGAGGAGPAHWAFSQFLVAVGDGARGADAAQPGADCDGVFKGSVVLL